MKDRIKRRPWGQRAVDKAIELFETDERFMMINAFCGSGKTLTLMDIANELHRRGHIDYVLALMPRRNLCRQYENDWKKDRKLFAPPVFDQIFHRDNNPPLLRDCMYDGPQRGVSTTYNSVASRLDLWESYLRDDCHGRGLLILDEAQILGSSSEDDSGGTQAFQNARRLNELARFTIGATGTHRRSDGKKLFKGRYSTPVNGECFLLADVEATYLEGVQEQYLRPFEFIKEDGTALREYLDSQGDEPEKLVVSQMTRGMSGIIKHPSFWMKMVDRAYEELCLIRREVDPRFCMLIGACDQDHARKIHAYCLKKFPDIGSLLAISDDDRAVDNLELFKRSRRYGILTTVGMAYVGYNHPWISVVLCLGAFRYFGWLDQFAMRGGRVVDGVPVELQVNRVIGPDDRYFCKWADMRRRDSDEGLRLRVSSTDSNGLDGPRIQDRLSYILTAEMTTETAFGMDPAHDLTNPNRLAEVKQVRSRYQLGAVSLPGLNALLLDYGIVLPSESLDPSSAPSPSPDPVPPSSDHVTNSDRDKKIRDRLTEITKKVDGMMRQIDPNTEWGWARKRANSHFHIDTIDGLGTGRLAEILAWVEGTLYPGVLAAWNRHKSA